VIVGFPFSTIRVEDTIGVSDVAELVARLCRLLADDAPAEALADLAEDATGLYSRLSR
jgi:hypothetical protein